MGDIAAATAAASKSSSSSFTLLLLIALVFIGFYFLMIRPQQRRRQQAQQQQNTVTPGARVRTTAGMYATVSAVDGDDVETVIVEGKTIVKDKKLLTFDENDAQFIAQRAASKLWDRLKTATPQIDSIKK